jgi:hypothetical protein
MKLGKHFGFARFLMNIDALTEMAAGGRYLVPQKRLRTSLARGGALPNPGGRMNDAKGFLVVVVEDVYFPNALGVGLLLMGCRFGRGTGGRAARIGSGVGLRCLGVLFYMTINVRAVRNGDHGRNCRAGAQGVLMVGLMVCRSSAAVLLLVVFRVHLHDLLHLLPSPPLLLAPHLLLL